MTTKPTPAGELRPTPRTLIAQLKGIVTHLRECRVNGAVAYPNLQGDADWIEQAIQELSSLSPQEGVGEPVNIESYETDEWACAAGVRRFAMAMRDKLDRKRKAGRGGWNRPDECSAGRLREMLRDHVVKGDPLDIANFCMMIWNRENPNG